MKENTRPGKFKARGFSYLCSMYIVNVEACGGADNYPQSSRPRVIKDPVTQVKNRSSQGWGDLRFFTKKNIIWRAPESPSVKFKKKKAALSPPFQLLSLTLPYTISYRFPPVAEYEWGGWPLSYKKSKTVRNANVHMYIWYSGSLSAFW